MPPHNPCMDKATGARHDGQATRQLFSGALLSLTLWALVPAAAAAKPSGDIGETIRKAVVKVYVTSQEPNQVNPWQAGSVSSGYGSGCVISGRRILTAAHVVARQTYLQVRRHGETRKHDARVLFVAHDVDLALLTVDDPAFFDGIEPLDLASLPAAQAAVTVLGFPYGGDTLSLTNGVVSRVEHQYYSHSGGTFLTIQIDAAVNPGNSGGPVIEGQRLVGIAMQGITSAQNISYIVPSTVIRRFLDDVADGAYDGVPRLGVNWQALESRAMRRHYGVEHTTGGVLLSGVAPGTGAAAALRPGDVLLSIDGTAIAEDGTVEFRPGERTSFEYAVDGKQRGAEVGVELVRDGRRCEARIRLTARLGEGNLVPLIEHEAQPSYFIFGGVVLRPLTADYIRAFGSEWWRDAPSDFLAASPRTGSFQGEGLVAMTSVFPDEVNQGYQGFSNELVTGVDGVRPRNFRHAVELVEKGQDEFLTLTLAGGKRMVLNREAVKTRQAAILVRYGLPNDRSKDLRTADAKRTAAGLSSVRRVVIGMERDDPEVVPIAIRDRADLLAEPQR